MKYSIILSFSFFLAFLSTFYAQKSHKNRVIILSDIEADPDDTQSFVHLFLYANEIDIKDMVATTSCWLQTKINPESLRKLLKPMATYNPI